MTEENGLWRQFFRKATDEPPLNKEINEEEEEEEEEDVLERKALLYAHGNTKHSAKAEP